MSVERSKSSNVNFRDAVVALVRPELQYDGEKWRKLRTLGSIACTHGASIASITRLARDGRFSGGEAALGGEFFTTPNEKYRHWDKAAIGQEVLDMLEERERPAGLETSIGYAETAEVSERRHNLDFAGVLHPGVVIAFNRRVLVGEMELHEDISDDSLELVLPRAPEIDAIEGIYPVDQLAAEALTKALQRMLS